MTMMALVLTIAAQAQRDTIGVSRFTAIYRYECKTADADGQPVTDSMYIAVQTSGGITKSFPYEEYDRQKKGGSRIADGYLAAQHIARDALPLSLHDGRAIGKAELDFDG